MATLRNRKMGYFLKKYIMGKKILITGCSGLVGVHLVKKTVKLGYDVFGIDIFKHKELENLNFNYIDQDLTDLEKLIKLFEKENFDVVLNTFGIKGSPLRAKTRPIDFLYPSIKVNNEIIDLCAKRNIYLVYVSSIGVYAPAEKFVEDDVWKTLPGDNDWFPSWSKRIGEILLEAQKVQNNYTKWSIIRPANIFGEYEKFDGNGTVISSVIKKVVDAYDNISCWGDGSPIRDFVYAGDVADAIIQLFTNELNITINFGSGVEVTISEIVNKIVDISNKKLKIEWDTSKPNGDLKRLMDTTFQEKHKILPKTNLNDALDLSYEYYVNNYYQNNNNYSDFLFENGYYVGLTKDIFPLWGNHKDLLNKIYNIPITSETFYICYELFNENEMDIKMSSNKMNLDFIPKMDKYILENNKLIFQRWLVLNNNYSVINDHKNVHYMLSYFRKWIEKFVFDIYPDLKDNIFHNDHLTLYNNGDFISSHKDGLDTSRRCAILIYLSEKFENSGGYLVIEKEEEEIYVEPYIDNFVILDFTKHNINHSVKPVMNNFKRYTYVDFIYNLEEHNKTKKV